MRYEFTNNISTECYSYLYMIVVVYCDIGKESSHLPGGK
jgi:hypothetical protein